MSLRFKRVPYYLAQSNECKGTINIDSETFSYLHERGRFEYAESLPMPHLYLRGTQPVSTTAAPCTRHVMQCLNQRHEYMLVEFSSPSAVKAYKTMMQQRYGGRRHMKRRRPPGARYNLHQMQR